MVKLKNVDQSQTETGGVAKIELKIDWTALRQQQLKHEAREKINRLELVKVKKQHPVNGVNPQQKIIV